MSYIFKYVNKLFLIQLLPPLGKQIEVTDFNDNCPSLNQTTYALTPMPILSTNPMLRFNATDSDSGLNAAVTYYATGTTVVLVLRMW